MTQRAVPEPTRLHLARPDTTLTGDTVGEGPPVLLLHAGGERREVWSPVREALAAAGYETVAYDLRGHGENRETTATDLTPVAADVAAMIGEFDTAPVVAGASLGGFAALLAATDPAVQQAIAALVLVDVVPDPPPDQVRAWLAKSLGPQGTNPLVENILARSDELRRAAAQLSIPVLLLRGEHSPLTAADTSRLRDLTPQTREAVIPAAGHLLAREAPQQVAEHLLTVLTSPEVRARRIDRYLTQAGTAAIPHPGGTLRNHLDRTAATLRDWNAPPWLMDAAHTHAAYGTDGFPQAFPGATRTQLRAVVGNRAEALVDRYGTCARQTSYPTFLTTTPTHVHRLTGTRTPFPDEWLHPFAELTVANELDVLAYSPSLAAQHASDILRLFTTWSPLLRPAARQAVARWNTSHHKP